MKLSTMWKDTLESLVKSPVTQKYPFERLEAPEHLRSLLHWDAEQCTGCGLCAKDCPANAIDIITLDRKAKRFVFRYYADRCTFCAQCVVSCRQGCLEMANDEWELASLSRLPLEMIYGTDADIEEALGNGAEAGAEASAG